MYRISKNKGIIFIYKIFLKIYKDSKWIAVKKEKEKIAGLQNHINKKNDLIYLLKNQSKIYYFLNF